MSQIDLKKLHVRRLGRINPGWGVTQLSKAVYVAAFGRGIAFRWCDR